jgi:hypothetical protein
LEVPSICILAANYLTRCHGRRESAKRITQTASPQSRNGKGGKLLDRSPDTITFGKIKRFIDGSSLEYLVFAEIHTPGATIAPMKRPA